MIVQSYEAFFYHIQVKSRIGKINHERQKEINSAICEFYCLLNYWQPKTGESLFRFHEKCNPFDVFTINTSLEEGHIVVNQSRKARRTCKYLLDKKSRSR